MAEEQEKNGSKQDEITKLVEIHTEVAEEALSSGFGVFSTPGKPAASESEKAENEKDE